MTINILETSASKINDLQYSRYNFYDANNLSISFIFSILYNITHNVHVCYPDLTYLDDINLQVIGEENPQNSVIYIDEEEGAQ